MLSSWFTMDHAAQALILLAVWVVKRSVGHVLDDIKEMRADIAKEHERFKEYVRSEQCNIHRQEIDRHIKESENRISRMLQNCKRHEDVQG